MKVSNNLDVWKAFVFTASTGNVTETSIQLGAEISTISRYIHGLEAEFGILFDRKKRPWKLTKRGKELMNRVRPLIDGFDSLQQLCGQGRKKITIRLSAPASLGRDFITSMIMNYSEINKNVQFELQQPTGVEGLMNGSTDVAFLIEPPPNNNLIIRKNVVFSTFIFTSKKYLKNHPEPITPEDLSAHVGILHSMPEHSDTRFLFRENEVSNTLIWKQELSFNDQGNIKRLLLEGKGISPDLTPTICLNELKKGEIVPVLKGWRRAPWRFCVATNRVKEKRNPELAVFADWYSQKQLESAQSRMKIAEELISTYWAHRGRD